MYVVQPAIVGAGSPAAAAAAVAENARITAA
jgi:hypothetical protein